MHRLRTSHAYHLGIACLAVLLIGASAVHAQSWAPPEPTIGDWDWIQMKSGEWFKGEIKSLRDTALEFDSDELDLLELDWGDVAALRTPHVLTFRIEDIGVFAGTATLRDGTLSIRGVDGTTHEFPQSSVLMILEGSGREREFWSVKSSLGLVARSGNTNQVDFNTFTRVQRRTAKSRGVLTYGANIGEVNSETTIENHNATGTIDMVISSGFFVTPASVNFFKDRFQNINSRSTFSAGLGYQIFDKGNFEWKAGLSGGYQVTRFNSVQPGEDDSEDNFSLIPNTSLSADLSENVELDFNYNAQIGLPDVKRTFHHAQLILSVDVFGDLINIDWSVIWDRTESPKTDADGNVPVRDDYRTTFGFGIDI